MKSQGTKPVLQNTLVKGNNNRPEIRDNLDSREGEEQQSKGNDVTHNKKENKADHLKKKK